MQNLFTNTKSWLAESGIQSGLKGLSLEDKPDSTLLKELGQAEQDVHAALCNSFDTPRAMQVILRLVNVTNSYLKDNKDADLAEIRAIARWITKVVGIFGLDANAEAPYDGLGWASTLPSNVDPKTAVEPYASMMKRVQQDAASLGVDNDVVKNLAAKDPSAEFDELAKGGSRDVEQLSLPYLRVIAQLRDELRRIVSSQTPDVKKALLALTDRIRDYDFTNLGVYLDDRPDNQPSLIKFVPAAELIATRDEKAAREAEKAKKKEEARLAQEKTARDAREKAKIPPEQMFKADERYAEWDEQGMPAKMKDGSDVPKSQLKSLKKLWDKQKRAHDDLKAKGGL